MAYDENLDQQVRVIVEKHSMMRKTMFGGTCYLEDRKMVCGVWKDNLILRLDDEEGQKALDEGIAEYFAITGKPMKGWVMIRKDQLTIAKMEYWIERARFHVGKLEARKI